MKTELQVPRTPRKVLFGLVIILLALGCMIFHEALERRAAAGRREREVEALDRLDQEVLSLAEDLRRPNLVAALGAPVLAWAKKNAGSGPFAEHMAERIGRRFASVFPGAEIFAFNEQGTLAYQTATEPRRIRETLWRAMITLQQEDGWNPGDPRFQLASGFCRRFYGSLTRIADLVARDASPREFQDHGQMRLSWIIPAARFQSGSGEREHPGQGGVWIILDPGSTSVRKLEKRLLKRLRPWADVGMIVRRTRHRPVIEVRQGYGGVLPKTLRQFFRGRTEWSDRLGFWVGRYIPQGNARYLVAGFNTQRLEGFLDRGGPFLQFAGLLAALALAFFFWNTLWSGIPTAFGLHSQVIALFALTTLLPLGAVFLQGVDLSGESARKTKLEWERRIQARHHEIDHRHLAFQKDRASRLRSIENELTARLPLSGTSLPDLCGGLEKFEVMMIDEQGNRTSLVRNCEATQSQGEYPALMARQLLELVEGEGRIPNPGLTSDFFLLPGQSLENLLFTFFRSERIFNRLQVRQRNVIQQSSVLYDRSANPPRVIGLISWAFDDVAFSRDFAREVMIGMPGASSTADPVRIGFASTEGDFYPSGWVRSESLRRMVERVRRFQANETGEVVFPDGRRFFAVVTCPVQISGYLMIGLLECRPEGKTGCWERAALILGFESPYPLEVDEIFALRVLAASIIVSLLLMIPMAMVVSRWIVGRIRDLTAMVRMISQKRFEARAAVAADDELGELAGAFNGMAAGLQERERMSRFVSDLVRDEVRKEDRESLAFGGERRDVAVLFTHIHHFDALVKAQPPEALIEMLNGYFTFVGSCIDDENGSIDKLIGDAVMAVFFHRPGCDHPALRAFRAARSIMRAEKGFNQNRRQNGDFEVRTDIGIQYGPAISGKIGSRHGMIDFTVIGDTVNTAARIQAQAAAEPEPSLLYSRELLEHLPPAQQSRFVKESTLKGKSGTMPLFRPEV